MLARFFHSVYGGKPFSDVLLYVLKSFMKFGVNHSGEESTTIIGELRVNRGAYRS